MKTSKEFFERLGSDEPFTREIVDGINAKRNSGAKNYYETIIPVAAEHGYELTEEELDAISNIKTSELSDEELGKVAGGTSCITVVLGSIASISIVSAVSSISYATYLATED